MPDTKLCRKCGEVYPLDAFYKDSSKKLGVTSNCKRCMDAMKATYELTPLGLKKRRERDKKYYRQSGRLRNVKKLYGLTAEEYTQLVIESGEHCQCCGVSFTERLRAVDHCHTTNKVRGILCTNCNLVLGLAKESPETLRNLAKYLEVHNGLE